MYNYGGSFGSNCGCGSYNQPAFTPYYPYTGYNNNPSNYAIVLVLFILLVIVIGSRWAR